MLRSISLHCPKPIDVHKFKRTSSSARASRVTEIYGRARVQCTKICDLFLRSKARSVRRGQKRSRLHISAFLTCCIDVAGGGGGGGGGC